MSKRWVRIWDDGAKRWFDALIEDGGRPSLYRGTNYSVSTAKETKTVLLGPDKKPIPSPARPMGFRKP